MEDWLETISALTCFYGSAQPAREMACTCRAVDNGGEHQRQQTVLQQQFSICPKPNQLWNYSRTLDRSIKTYVTANFFDSDAEVAQVVARIMLDSGRNHCFLSYSATTGTKHEVTCKRTMRSYIFMHGDDALMKWTITGRFGYFSFSQPSIMPVSCLFSATKKSSLIADSFLKVDMLWPGECIWRGKTGIGVNESAMKHNLKKW